ncbi:MAG: TIR domain-containing protein [Novosphingobium sp.]
MTAPDIFLSYNREDQAVAKLYADAFAAEGLNVWWDTALRSGEAYDEVTEAALRGAKAVVVLWSPRSVVSRWVRAEATIADRCKTLVPVTIEPCERPIMFELTQTADLAHWTGAADDKAWLGFLSDVRRFVGREATATPIIAAPEPAPVRHGERGEAPSLAVLPFTNRSGVPEDEVFAIGMVEDVIDALSQGVNVRVISSSSTARFRSGAMPDVEAMGRQLGVRYLLEGNVRRAGQDLRVTAQLVEAARGDILWTQRFDRPLAELAALQDELVREVAAHFDMQIHQLEMARALKKPNDLTAWEAATLSFSSFRRIGHGSLAMGIEQAQRAVKIDPDYGAGHAMVAVTSALEYFLLCPDDVTTVTRIEGHIARALALDPDSCGVLTRVAQAQNFIGQAEAALPNVQRAIQKSPNYSYAHMVCGTTCVLLNRSDEAIRHLDIEARLSPGWLLEYASLYWRAFAEIERENWEAAIVALDRSIVLDPTSSVGFLNKAILTWREGRTDVALALLARARQTEPELTRAQHELRVSRCFANSPLLGELLTHLRALWAELEGNAP